MLKEEINNTFQILGLSDKASRVYFAVLELGEPTAVEVAKRTSLQRTYIYDIARDLAERGYLSYVDRGKIRRYSAASPKRIERILLNKIETYQELLPSLEAIFTQAPSRAKVRFFEGISANRAIEDEVLAEAKTIDIFGSNEQWVKNLGTSYSSVKKWVAKRIKIREICKRLPETLKYRELYRPPNQEMRFIRPEWNFETDFGIWNNKVAILYYGPENMHCVVIESTPITNSFRTIFNILWNLAIK